MFIELVDSLRCPNAHADSWLVAACDRMQERDIVEGRLGCPVCQVEYPIHDGAVWFDPPRSPTRDPWRVDPDRALRVAAFLDLTEPRGFAILEGRWGAEAIVLGGIAPTPLLLLNPEPAQPSQPGISVVFCGRGAPVAHEKARGAALDPAGATPTAGVVESVQPGGRLLAMADLPLPPGVGVIARDATVWVASRDVPTVGLSRAPRSER